MVTDQILSREIVEEPTFTRGEDGSLMVSALMVPHMSPTEVVDVNIEGDLFAYREQFAPGAFARAAENAHRVRLVWGHSNDFPNQLGRGVRFWDGDRGSMGEFKVSKSIAERAREELTGQSVSVSFRSLAPRPYSERPGDLVTREAVHLVHLGVVDAPAYAGARILELRSDMQEVAAELRAEQDVAAEELRGRQMVARLLERSRSWRALSDDEEAYVREYGTSDQEPASV